MAFPCPILFWFCFFLLFLAVILRLVRAQLDAECVPHFECEYTRGHQNHSAKTHDDGTDDWVVAKEKNKEMQSKMKELSLMTCLIGICWCSDLPDIGEIVQV